MIFLTSLASTINAFTTIAQLGRITLALTSMTPGMFNERPSDFLPGS